MDITHQIKQLFQDIRSHHTLVHHITNYVTVNDCANIVLAIGANPVMADDVNEVEDMVSICNALVINIGTLNDRTIESMLKAGKKANDFGIPVVLDPVGVGATPFRFHTVEKLLQEVHFSVIKGNMAEIKVIAGLQAKRTGVDSLEEEDNRVQIAQNLAQKLKCVIAITGKIDVISDGTSTYEIASGTPALSRLTGTGCMSASLIGSFLGVSKNALLSAIVGIGTMSIAGEKACASSQGAGDFKVKLMDAVSSINGEEFMMSINSKKITP